MMGLAYLFILLSLLLSFLPLIRTGALPSAQNQPDDVVDAFPVLDFREDGRAAVSVGGRLEGLIS